MATKITLIVDDDIEDVSPMQVEGLVAAEFGLHVKRSHAKRLTSKSYIKELAYVY